MRTLKILGFLMTYPQAQHQEVANECAMLLESEKWLSDKTLSSLKPFFKMLEQRDLLDLQEDYVALFDRTPSLSLHLFEHVHGDSRDRGQAMVDLMKVYEEAGLFIDTEETPDYLPLFTEYLATLSSLEASDTVGGVVNIISALAERLKNRQSPYASILQALVETASRQPDAQIIAESLKKSSGKALSIAEIDKEWEEQFAFENTAQTTGIESGCPKAQDMLARMNSYKTEERV
jgi:nitrate reductase delta subunit